MMRLQYILTIFLLLLFCTLATAADLELSVDRNPVPFGQSVELTVEARGDQGAELDLEPLTRDFDILGRSQGKSISYFNGQATRLSRWTLTLMPKKTGDLMIPPLSLGTLRSEPLRLRVLPPDPNGSPGNSPFFIRLELGKETAYVDSQVKLKVRLYLGQNVLQGAVLTEPEFPQGAGEVRRLGEDRITESLIDGQRHQVVERDYALFPSTPGPQVLEPLMFEGQTARNRSFFNPYADGSGIQRIFSAPIRFDVQPLPGGSGTSSPISARELKLLQHWSPDASRISVGDALTHTLVLEAKGQRVEALSIPQIPYPESFKIYADRPEKSEEPDPLEINGRIELKTALIPTQGGKYQIPETQLRWWNSEQEQYETLLVPGRTFEVIPSQVPALQQAPPAPGLPPGPEEKSAETGTDSAELPDTKPGFWMPVALLLGAGWMLTGLLWWRSARRHPGTVPAGSEPSALQQEEARLKKACDSGRPGDIVPALLGWARTRYPQNPPMHLQELGLRLPAEAREEVDKLCQRLSRSGDDCWNADALWKALPRGKEPKAQKKDSALPPLYP